jgi:hypothetical protein
MGMSANYGLSPDRQEMIALNRAAVVRGVTVLIPPGSMVRLPTKSLSAKRLPPCETRWRSQPSSALTLIRRQGSVVEASTAALSTSRRVPGHRSSDSGPTLSISSINTGQTRMCLSKTWQEPSGSRFRKARSGTWGFPKQGQRLSVERTRYSRSVPSRQPSQESRCMELRALDTSDVAEVARTTIPEIRAQKERTNDAQGCLE